MSKTAKITDLIFELFHLHFQWIIYTLKGFVIAGLFPSIAAIFAVIRHWLLKGRTEMLTKLFKQYYDENFRVANIFGWSVLLITLVVITNFIYMSYYPENIRLIMYAILVFMSIILFIIWVYLFPTIVHYKLSNHDLFLVMLKTGFSSILGLVLQIIFIGILLLIIFRLPALLLFFGLTPLAFFQMMVSIKIFNKLN
ncbi:YesL family protein [Pseudogracilibacillus sp. SO30301A]|uniref:YesL family protein n=1 Tax=Pseudogracilibacillus sp. SO30301A TaxID=3098291 RepID=UPI00300DDE6D